MVRPYPIPRNLVSVVEERSGESWGLDKRNTFGLKSVRSSFRIRPQRTQPILKMKPRDQWMGEKFAEPLEGLDTLGVAPIERSVRAAGSVRSRGYRRYIRPSTKNVTGFYSMVFKHKELNFGGDKTVVN